MMQRRWNIEIVSDAIHGWIVIAILLLSTAPLQAREPDTTATASTGDTLYLDLEAALRIAGSESPDAIRAELSERSAYLGYRLSYVGDYHPRIDLSVNVPTYRESIVERYVSLPDDQGGFTESRQWVNTRTLQWSGDLTLLQPLPTGGQVRLRSYMYELDYSSDLQESDVKEVRHSWRLEFSQDLLRLNQARLQRKRAKIAFRKAEWARRRSNRNLAFQVLNRYYTLIMETRELEITRDDLQVSRETAGPARRKYEAGLIPEVQALQLELEVIQKETDLESQASRLESSLDEFRRLIGLSLEQPVQVVGEPTFRPIDVDLEESISRALEQREDIREAEIDLTLAKYDLKDARRPYLPSAGLTAYYDLDRLDDSLDEALREGLGEYNESRGVVFTLSMPLLTFGRRSIAVQQAKIGMRRNEIEADEIYKQVVLDVREAVRSLRESEQRYETTLRGLDIAEQSHQMTRQRFENGQVTAREWIEAQLSLKRSRINATRALIDHILAIARYRVAVGEAAVAP
ncbi:hypothetical protein GF324_11095 [bacterium]|nr:hypothetical protein [bacterium]